ncbi:MAG: hypothetical protein HYS20_05610 [Rhodocyclales bacterium]|nr:hypothetical protein [Rhodocyclales bacterium]
MIRHLTLPVIHSFSMGRKLYRTETWNMNIDGIEPAATITKLTPRRDLSWDGGLRAASAIAKFRIDIEKSGGKSGTGKSGGKSGTDHVFHDADAFQETSFVGLASVLN